MIHREQAGPGCGVADTLAEVSDCKMNLPHDYGNPINDTTTMAMD